MNEYQVDKIIKVILSCKTIDQYFICHDWVYELKRLYNISPRQYNNINEAFLKVSNDLNFR